jgi:hypothetical protein
MKSKKVDAASHYLSMAVQEGEFNFEAFYNKALICY